MPALASSKPKVVGYTRVSTVEQVEAGLSLEAQEAALKEYCTFAALDLVAVIRDEGVSAGRPLSKRPGGQHLLGLIDGKQVAAVVAWKLDRLFRSATDCLTTVERWDKAGIVLHLRDMGGQALDTGTALGRFFLTIMAGAAELERNQTRDRTVAALDHKRSKGERVGQVPYGFRVAADGVHLEQDPGEWPVVGQLHQLRGTGMSYRAIAERLNQEAVPARGSRWHPTTVSRVLARELEPADV